MPGIGGTTMSLNIPIALITNRAVSVRPSAIRTRQRAVGSSHLSDATSCSNLQYGNMPYLYATCSTYSRISACPAYGRDQSTLGSNENEYRCDCTSHSAPGYRLCHHVPPTPAAFSTITKSSMPDSASRIPAQMPPGPAPMISTVTSCGSAGTDLISLMGCGSPAQDQPRQWLV